MNTGDTAQETFSKITAGDYDFENEEFDDISEEAKGFIRHLLVGKMEERLTAEECLHHPWLRYEPNSSFSKIMVIQITILDFKSVYPSVRTSVHGLHFSFSSR